MGNGARADAKAQTTATERAAVVSGTNSANPATSAESKLFSTPFTPSPSQPFAHPYFWAPFILMGNWL